MKYKLVFTFALLSLTYSTLLGQSRALKGTLKKLENITSASEAEDLLNKDHSLLGEIVTLNPETDSSAFAMQLMSMNEAEVKEFISDDKKYVDVVKVLETEEAKLLRVSYIFFDNSKVGKSKIEKTRAEILKKLEAGSEFEELAKQYSMDGNAQNGGDLGWFIEGQMVQSFEEAIKAHTKGDVYFVDIPENRWYYVVKNTHEPKKEKLTKVLVIKHKL